MKKNLVLTALVLLFTYSLSAQDKPVRVNHFTGTASVVIPLFNIQSGDVQMPVNLIYSTNGVKVKDVEGNAGIDWNCTTGGEISRILRGLPDDCKRSVYGLPRLGWLYNNNGAKISNFNVANDNNMSSCPDETADLAYLNTNFSDLSDTEPDLFYVNAPGLSCQLVFDNNHIIRTIPYQDIKVTWNSNIDGRITGFTVINDKGIQYQFLLNESTTRVADNAGSDLRFFKTAYNQYIDSVTYTSSWKLTSITDRNDNKISFSYDSETASYTYSQTPVNVILGAASGAYTKNKQYIITESTKPRRLNTVSYGNGSTLNTAFTIKYLYSSSSNLPLISELQGYGKTWRFKYGGSDSTGVYGEFNRSFLIGITSPATIGPDRYRFDYYARDSVTNNIPLPDSSSTQIDYWGYYNASSASDLVPPVYVNPSNAQAERYRLFPGGSDYVYQLGGSNRSVNPTAVFTGALKSIYYPAGGHTVLSYESNDYYDTVTGTTVQGGGIRVKQVRDYDNVSSAGTMERNFTYTDPATGRSAGRPVSLPVYAFTRPYTGQGSAAEQWNYSTVRMEDSFLPEDNSILYRYVRESVPGAGSTLYEFTLPGVYGDNTAADWSPTVSNFARTGCNAAGFVTNARQTYPFAPNTNYDFERGLIKSAVSFNESGSKVSETTYSYQRTGSPAVITALKIDDNDWVKAYAKYTIYTGCSELRSQEVRKVYNTADAGQVQQSSSSYYYTGSQHKLLTRQDVSGSDGSTERSFFRYTKDYAVSSPSETAASAIYTLQQLNVNVPVEQYTQVERNGTIKTVGGTLVKYGVFNPSGSRPMYLPAQQLKLDAGSGLSDFSISSISSGSFTSDPRYRVVQNNTAYDYYGYLLSRDDNKKNTETVLTDHSTLLPVARISGARYDEIAFNDFDSDLQPATGFSSSDNSYIYLSGRSGKNAISMSTATVLTKVINKAAGAKNYIFSIWGNGYTTGNLTLSLINSSNQTYNYPLPVTTADSWRYYELKVPVTAMSPSFTAKLVSGINLAVDDIAFYPEAAEISSAWYDKVSRRKLGETNTNGISSYYAYDQFGRPTYLYDQDRNIIQRKTYIDAGDQQPFNSLYFNVSGAMTTLSPVMFSTSSWKGGSTATWNFGDGTPPVIITNNSSPGHTYAVAGTYTVTLTVSSPIFGQRTVSTNITIAPSTIKVRYANYTENSRILNVHFYQGDVVRYQFSEADLNKAPSVVQGVYSVKVYFKNLGEDFQSIKCNPSNGGGTCFYPSGSPHTVTLDLTRSASVVFIADTNGCP